MQYCRHWVWLVESAVSCNSVSYGNDYLSLSILIYSYFNSFHRILNRIFDRYMLYAFLSLSVFLEYELKWQSNIVIVAATLSMETLLCIHNSWICEKRVSDWVRQASMQGGRAEQTDQCSTSADLQITCSSSDDVYKMTVLSEWVTSLSALFRNSQNNAILIKNTRNSLKLYYNLTIIPKKSHLFFLWISPAHQTDKISCLRLSKLSKHKHTTLFPYFLYIRFQ